MANESMGLKFKTIFEAIDASGEHRRLYGLTEDNTLYVLGKNDKWRILDKTGEGK